MPTAPVAAAVVSDDMIEPRNTPCSQSRASCTSGTTVARRPPNRNASIGTPAGSSHSGAIDGHCAGGAVKRAFGCAAGVSDSGVQSLPFQSIACAGGSAVSPSHQTSPSSVSAQLVKIVSCPIESIALGLVERSRSRSDAEEAVLRVDRAQAAVVVELHPGDVVADRLDLPAGSVGISIARLVLPQALGNAAATYLTAPSGEVSLRISMCSASQPSSRAITEAIRSAKHFLPSSALPP